MVSSKYFDKGVFGKRLLEAMRDNNDTTYSLGEYLRLSNGTISRYTTGEIAPKIPTIQAMAEKYKLNPAWLMGVDGASKYYENIDTSKKIPIIGTIAAGLPILAQENIDGYEYTSESEKADFCLRVKGDSMIGARIYDGDIVFIRKQPDVESGEIAAVIINGEEATLKRIYKAGTTLILHAENPAYKDITINKKDRLEAKIIGKALSFKSEVRYMASIKKRPNGTWQATIYVGRDADGKQMFRYVTKPSEKECKSAARKIEQEIEEGKLVNIENIRFVAWVEQYLEINKNKYASSTRVLYKRYLDCHFKPFFGNLKLKQINEIHIKKFQNQLLEQMLPSSARRIMGTLNKILKEALKDKSPAKDIELPKANKPRSKAPTTEEFMQIHEAVKGTKYEPHVLLAGWCGFRRGEIFALKPDDINFKDGSIRIDESYSINEQGVYDLGPPKSENGYRTEVAPKYLMDLIKKMLVKNPKINERIFSGRPDNFSSDYAELINQKKLPKYRFHDLRHYHATWLFENGVPDKYAAKRMGQTLDVLKNIYQHLGVEKQREMENKIRSIDISTR